MDGRLVLTAQTPIATDIVARAVSLLNNLAQGVESPVSVSEYAIKIPFSNAVDLPKGAGDFVGDAQVDVNVISSDQIAPKLFVADMDSTMIGQECIDELADYAGVKAKISEITEAAMQGKLDFEASLRARVALLQGLDVSVLQQCFDERIAPNLGALELLTQLGDAGIRRVLVSGGFTFFASRIAGHLGFDRFEANEFDVVENKLTGKLNGKIVDRAFKATVLNAECDQLGIDAKSVIAIGDGANDLDMINAAGIGIAYKAKPALEAQADIILRYSRLDALIDIFEI